MNILPIILARGGSKRIPRKNILPMAGKPMIAWTIECALKAQGLERVIVSTDDAEIAEVCQSWGADVPFLRPENLATDTATSVDVVFHVLDWLSQTRGYVPSFILVLQPTSPLRIPDDIEASIALQTEKKANAVVSVCKSPHPALFLKQVLDDGRLAPFELEDLKKDFYYLNGAVYLVATSAFLKEKAFIPQNTYAYEMPVERSIDVDTSWDFYLADRILKDQNAIFNS
jgi:CMP-N,N'-diacetyllegionaminic acid synthase